jgi:hypothetical protein
MSEKSNGATNTFILHAKKPRDIFFKFDFEL